VSEKVVRVAVIVFPDGRTVWLLAPLDYEVTGKIGNAQRAWLESLDKEQRER